MNECKNHDMQYVNATKSNGNPFIKKQCLSCGEHDCKHYKYSDIGGKEKIKCLPIFNNDLLQSFYESQKKARTDKKEAEKKEWFVGYNVYLKSDKWKNKRLLVLQRDKNICQTCLINKATEVHHLTYRHVGNETLLDLVSICNPCHNKITEIERRQRGE